MISTKIIEKLEESVLTMVQDYYPDYFELDSGKDFDTHYYNNERFVQFVVWDSKKQEESRYCAGIEKKGKFKELTDKYNQMVEDSVVEILLHAEEMGKIREDEIDRLNRTLCDKLKLDGNEYIRCRPDEKDDVEFTEEEQGPYGGAFRDWQDFYSMKGIEPDVPY